MKGVHKFVLTTSTTVTHQIAIKTFHNCNSTTNNYLIIDLIE